MQIIENVNILTTEGFVYGSVTIGDDGRIQAVTPSEQPAPEHAPMLLPGVIDAHVHFREPGMTQKADIASESLAALYGGVTYVMDMPNVNPTTTTPEALAEKHRLFNEKCLVNYGIWYGITSDNIDQAIADYGRPNSPHRNEICGFKVFLGSSTGGMLMNDGDKLRHLMANTDRVIGVHSEDENTILRNREKFIALEAYHRGTTPDKVTDLPVEMHPKVRDIDACMATTRIAGSIASEVNAQLHICHITTAEELQYIRSLRQVSGNTTITTEACIAHLWFSQDDYKRLGTFIKCNPAIKRIQDRDALRRGLTDGTIDTIATDHAPHLLSDKQGGALKAASGMPSVQFSLLAGLELVREGVLSIQQLSHLMSAAPAKRFGIEGRGEIRPGFWADLVLVDPNESTTVTRQIIKSKCGWSPFEGTTFHNKIVSTWINGKQHQL